MSLKTIYDKIAHQYATANLFGAITESHACAIKQILASGINKHDNMHVLDLGVGDAAFLKKISVFLSQGIYTGVDISKNMLQIAQDNLPQLIAIEQSSDNVHLSIPMHTQDLILAHFMNAYIPIDTLFNQVDFLLAPSGYFSYITTTYDSFPIAQQSLAKFINADSIWSSIVGHYYKSIVKNTMVALNLTALFNAFDLHKFDIVKHQRLEIPILLNNINELERFGVEGTWFLNAMNINIRLLPRALVMKKMRQLLTKIITFPYSDTHIIDVILARKR